MEVRGEKAVRRKADEGGTGESHLVTRTESALTRITRYASQHLHQLTHRRNKSSESPSPPRRRQTGHPHSCPWVREKPGLLIKNLCHLMKKTGPNGPLLAVCCDAVTFRSRVRLSKGLLPIHPRSGVSALKNKKEIRVF